MHIENVHKCRRRGVARGGDNAVCLVFMQPTPPNTHSSPSTPNQLCNMKSQGLSVAKRKIEKHLRRFLNSRRRQLARLRGWGFEARGWCRTGVGQCVRGSGYGSGLSGQTASKPDPRAASTSALHHANSNSNNSFFPFCIIDKEGSVDCRFSLNIFRSGRASAEPPQLNSGLRVPVTTTALAKAPDPDPDRSPTGAGERVRSLCQRLANSLHQQQCCPLETLLDILLTSIFVQLFSNNFVMRFWPLCHTRSRGSSASPLFCWAVINACSLAVCVVKVIFGCVCQWKARLPLIRLLL